MTKELPHRASDVDPKAEQDYTRALNIARNPDAFNRMQEAEREAEAERHRFMAREGFETRATAPVEGDPPDLGVNTKEMRPAEAAYRRFLVWQRVLRDELN